jgi:hypothetical protein
MSRAMSKTVLVLLGGVLLTAIAQAAPLPSPGAVVTMDVDYFGCRSLDDLSHVVNLDWVKNDKIASIEYGTQHCVVLHQGERFMVQDASAVRSAVCLRQQPRSSDCVWTNAQMIKSP